MSYADALESYMIAEEGLFDRFKKKREEKENANRQQWLNSPNVQEAIPYINKKYGVDFEKLTKDDFKPIYQKLIASIKADAIKIANQLNSTKGLREKLIKKAIDDFDMEFSNEELARIKKGKIYTSDVESDSTGIYMYILNQNITDIATFGEPFEKLMNKKYENEIHVKLINKFLPIENTDISCRLLYGGFTNESRR